MERAIAATMNRMIRDGQSASICEADMPAGDMLDAMQRRLAILNRHMAAGGDQEAAAAVSGLLSAYPFSGDQKAAKAAIAAHVSVLAGLPAWAIRAACQAALTRDSGFAPAPGELLALARRECGVFERERANLQAILTARRTKAAKPGERERIKAGLDALRAELRSAR
jgi:hypothetical protein